MKMEKKALKKNKEIEELCHSNKDNYMMHLLADITKKAIAEGVISYDKLYHYNEEELWKILNHSKQKDLQELIHQFKTIKQIPIRDYPEIKKRILNPLVKGRRINEKINS